MATNRLDRGIRRVTTWWRPLALSAVAAAAIAALFTPVPALAAPNAPAAPIAPAVSVPDTGSRPTAPGTLTMPGQTTTTITPTTTTGIATDPLVAKIDKRRADIAALGDQLIQLGVDRDLARQQAATADQKVAATTTALTAAQQEANVAANSALQDAAALPPGTIGSGLQDLDALAAIQRGDSPGADAAARQVAIAQAAQQAALAEQATATASSTDLSAQYDKLNTQIAAKQAELTKWEQQNAAALAAAEATQSATDAQLGAQYLSTVPDGQGADPRAVAALQFALAQQGDRYVWSTEGPNTYDCSGLMFAAYRSNAAGNFPLQRVSRDQYWQTHLKSVDRYSLLPGDLLFFSSNSSWQGIHHVAMYAGNGMMVEAPRTGLNVRLVPVRWSSLFGATRVYGSVDGGKTTVPSGGSSSGGSSSGGSSSGGSSSGGSSSTPTKTPTPTKSATPTKTPTPTKSATPTKSPTSSPTPSQSASSTPTPTPSSDPPPTTPAPTASATSGTGSSGGSDDPSESSPSDSPSQAQATDSAAASTSSSESGSASASD